MVMIANKTTNFRKNRSTEQLQSLQITMRFTKIIPYIKPKSKKVKQYIPQISNVWLWAFLMKVNPEKCSERMKLLDVLFSIFP